MAAYSSISFVSQHNYLFLHDAESNIGHQEADLDENKSFFFTLPRKPHSRLRCLESRTDFQTAEQLYSCRPVKVDAFAFG